MKQIISCIVLLLIITLSAMSIKACSSSSDEPKDTDSPSEPTVTVSPINGALINDSTEIIITFSTTMDTTTMELSGTMSGESDGGIWSETDAANDTLTVGPASLWSESAQTLIVDIRGNNGIALDTLTLNYTVDATPPTGTPNPASGSSLYSDEDIIIVFNESIDSDSLSFTNSLMNDIGTINWSDTSFTDGTLTISPDAFWTTGAQSLEITVTDIAGNSITLNLNYTVVQDIDRDGSFYPTDCNDYDEDVHPAQTSWFSDPYSDDSFDYNCDGNETLQWTSIGSTTSPCVVGWDGSIPDCGETANYVTDTACTTESRTQVCH